MGGSRRDHGGDAVGPGDEPWFPAGRRPPYLYLLLNEIEMLALAEGCVTDRVALQARQAARTVGWMPKP